MNFKIFRIVFSFLCLNFSFNVFAQIPVAANVFSLGPTAAINAFRFSNPYLGEPFYRYKNQVHLISNETNNVFRRESNSVIGLEVSLGYGKLRYVFDNKSVYDFKPSLTKTGGVSIDFPLEVMEGKITVYNELTFSQFEAIAEQHIVDTNQYGFAEKFDSKLNFTPNILSLAHIVRYNFTPNEFKYFIGVGIYNSFVVSAINTKQTLITTSAGEHTSYEKAIPDPATHGLMLLATTGFTFRNIGFEIRYDPSRNYTNMVENYVFQQLFSAHFNIRFNPK